jgi:membrane associated rhomboid family serine protease
VATTPGQDQGTEPGTAVPVCYRHPRRETYLSCVRCGRPACPECLRSAAVGQQCVECVREGNRGVRGARNVFGGRPTAAAVVTWALVAINVLLYLVELAVPAVGNHLAMLGRGLLPDSSHLQGVAEGQWYRLITAAFVAPTGLGSLGPLDILFNMWALIVLGPALERQLGHLRYIAIYLVSALAGSVALLVLAPGTLAAGASGAIFGLFGAFFVASRRLQLDTRWIVTLVVINLVIGFISPQIAWQAHIGGLIAGGLLALAYAYAPRANRALIQCGATVLLIVILVLIVVARNHQLASAIPG